MIASSYKEQENTVSHVPWLAETGNTTHCWQSTNFLNSPYSEFHAWSPLILKLSCHSSSVSQNYIELNFFIFCVLLLFPKVKKLKRPIMSMYWCISHLYVEAVAFDYSSLPFFRSDSTVFPRIISMSGL